MAGQRMVEHVVTDVVNIVDTKVYTKSGACLFDIANTEELHVENGGGQTIAITVITKERNWYTLEFNKNNEVLTKIIDAAIRTYLVVNNDHITDDDYAAQWDTEPQANKL